VKGLLIRADERSLVIQSQNRESEIPKDSIRKLTVRRKGWTKAIWIGMAIGFGSFALATAGEGDFDQPEAALAYGAAGAGLGAFGGLAVRALMRNKLVYVAPRDAGK
jgi:hypothetical protein